MTQLAYAKAFTDNPIDVQSAMQVARAHFERGELTDMALASAKVICAPPEARRGPPQHVCVRDRVLNAGRVVQYGCADSEPELGGEKVCKDNAHPLYVTVLGAEQDYGRT